MSQKTGKSSSKSGACLKCEKKDCAFTCLCGKKICDSCRELREQCPFCKLEFDKKPYKKEEIMKLPAPKSNLTPIKGTKPTQGTLKGKNINYTELSRIRVIQKNLVYMIGLASSLAKEEVLKKPEYLGQYGNISKVVINKNNAYNPNGPHGPSYSAYVTFSNEKEATIAIFAIDEYEILERVIRASYGTTKYCTYFLKDQECINPDCLYLHAFGKETDFFTKDDVTTNKDIFIDQQKIAITNFKKYHAELIKQRTPCPEKAVFPTIESLTVKLVKITKEYEKTDMLQSTPEIEENKRRSIQIMKKNKIDINVPEKDGKREKKVSKLPKKPEKLINITDNFFDDELPIIKKESSKLEVIESPQGSPKILEEKIEEKAVESEPAFKLPPVNQEIEDIVKTPEIENTKNEGATPEQDAQQTNENVEKQASAEESAEQQMQNEKNSLCDENDQFEDLSCRNLDKNENFPEINEVIGSSRTQSNKEEVKNKSEDKNSFGPFRQNFSTNFGYTKNSRFAFANSGALEANENDEEFKDLSTSIQNYLRNPFCSEGSSDYDKNNNCNSESKAFSTFDDNNQKEENMTFTFNSYKTSDKEENSSGSSYSYFKSNVNNYSFLQSGVNYNFNFCGETSGKNDNKAPPIRHIIINHNNYSYNVNNNINLNNNYFGFPGQSNK